MHVALCTVAVRAAMPTHRHPPLWPCRCARSKAGRRSGAKDVAGEGREQQGKAGESSKGWRPLSLAPPLFLACLPRLHMSLSIRLPLSPPLNFPSESPLPSSPPSTSPPAHHSAHPPAAPLVASSQHSQQRLWVV
ncbi:unnamed protein product [Closterium sp. Naga37s-1]|nr:unnamed protein product [Closterium sp. Naga37s-1]